jgi:TatD DNase family protein
MAAIHPSETKNASDADFETVASYCARDEIVAVGETGLDYYWDRSFDERQKDFLRRHARLAAETDLPLVLHNREATGDLIRVLKEEKEALDDPARLRGVFHCFGGPAEAVPDVLALGFLVGIGGTLTFKNGGVPEAIADIPIEAIVLETDAPYLAPVPFRGKRNEPAHVRYVAERLAGLRSLSVREVADVTSANARRLFGIDPQAPTGFGAPAS